MFTHIQTALPQPGPIHPGVTNWLCLNQKETEVLIMNPLPLISPEGFKELSMTKGQISEKSDLHLNPSSFFSPSSPQSLLMSSFKYEMSLFSYRYYQALLVVILAFSGVMILQWQH